MEAAAAEPDAAVAAAATARKEHQNAQTQLESLRSQLSEHRALLQQLQADLAASVMAAAAASTVQHAPKAAGAAAMAPGHSDTAPCAGEPAVTPHKPVAMAVTAPAALPSRSALLATGPGPSHYCKSTGLSKHGAGRKGVQGKATGNTNTHTRGAHKRVRRRVVCSSSSDEDASEGKDDSAMESSGEESVEEMESEGEEEGAAGQRVPGDAAAAAARDDDGATASDGQGTEARPSVSCVTRVTRSTAKGAAGLGQVQQDRGGVRGKASAAKSKRRGLGGGTGAGCEATSEGWPHGAKGMVLQKKGASARGGSTKPKATRGAAAALSVGQVGHELAGVRGEEERLVQARLAINADALEVRMA